MPELAAHEVQVWQVSLDAPPVPFEELASVLSPDESERAARFHFERDRRRFIASRGILRAILSPLTGAAPAAVRFRYGPRGKPALEGVADGDGIRFNVSHSDGLALYALTRRREVGVDVERIRPVEGADRIAARFFSEPERAALREVPPSARLDAFFTCWTRKEAYVKARGEGLGYPLDGFAVTVAPGGKARLWSAGADAGEIARWSLLALPQAPGYVAALAVEGHDWRVTTASWPPR